MMKDVLLFLWIFIVPVFTISYNFFKSTKRKLPESNNKIPLEFIVRFTLFGLLFLGVIFLLFSIILMPLYSEFPLLKGIVIMQIVIFNLTFLSCFVEHQKSIIKKGMVGFGMFLNAISMVAYVLSCNFSNWTMIIIALAYPVSFWYQLVSYASENGA